MSLVNIIIQFLNEKWLPNLLGLLGGLLGAWTFIDNYIIKFKPKIYIGTRIIIDTIKNAQGALQLNSIICSLELCNHRKKYGVIYDFAVRIYSAEEINSDKAIYYASEVVQKVPINIGELEKQEYDMFNPITVLPSSNRSICIVLSDVLNRSKMNIATGKSHYLEAYYQKSPTGRWYFIDKLYLFNKNILGPPDKRYIQFTVLDNDKTRTNINRSIRPQKTNLYAGASQKYVRRIIHSYKYKLLKNPWNRIKDSFISVPFFLNFALIKLYDKAVKIPIIKRYGRKIETVRVRIGAPELKPITLAAFEQIFSKLNKFAEQINVGAIQEAKITVEKENGSIIITRYKLAIKLYIAGDTAINVSEAYLNTFHNSRISYSLSLRNYIWNRPYWYLDNYGFTTIESFTVRVMDAFVIHSNY